MPELAYAALPTELEEREARSARRAVLFDTPTGRAAGRIYEAAAELHAALNDFVRGHSDPDAIEVEAADALRAAGLLPLRPTAGYGPDTFTALPTEAKGWLFMVDLMCSLTESYSPPDE